MKYIRFSIVPLLYLPLLIIANLLGGWYPLLNFLFILVCYLVFDRITDSMQNDEPTRFPFILNGFMYLHILLSFVAVASVCVTASDYHGLVLSKIMELTGISLSELANPSLISSIVAAVGTGFVISINMVVGHELTHRTLSKLDMFMGHVSLAIVGDSQFAISHVHCHHKNIGTEEDAATARRGENLYRFILRSALGQHREAWQFEKVRLERSSRSAFSFGNKLLPWYFVTLAIAACTFVLAGWMGVMLYLIIMLVSKANYESTNYIQHYGLVRIPQTKVRPEHSWDCIASYSSSALLNLTRHSDHHANPNKEYWLLGSTNENMMIEHGYVVQMMKALVPGYWFRMMEDKLIYWEENYATDAERKVMATQRQNWRKQDV